ncbi:hypothetical protein WKH27_16575 [Pantoea agglomerans]|uniref:hypothetical protein n=1 Tax=Enterobacter agglomerans TaxID=549 RepID=UPI0023AEABC0|nr:hypothetical protein [Pantoea agglomerans]WEC75234.1 hypothetical protein LDO72_23630 [Pantoea agglomerans]WNK56209.1 hypothetical protein RM154_23785 [Pantoea agglomerans]WNK74163.1 hypothetical protein RM155_23640 [Pantoea agglomerans]
MTPEIRRSIHAFRNALVLAADTRSHECFRMPRWRSDLNNFPHGCCDLSGNFLAQYLKDSYPTLAPVIVHMQTTADFSEKHQSSIQSHVITKVDNWYIDLTLNQFDEYRARVVIEEHTGTLGTLLRNIRKCDGSVKERDIQLNAFRENGQELYAWLCSTANKLLKDVEAENKSC